MHLLSATLDDRYRVLQYNQQPIDIVEGPAQLVIPLTTRMAARNRTRRAEGGREETCGLIEIDTYATNANHWNEVEKEEEKLVMEMMMTGSNWTKHVAATTGRRDVECDDSFCELCKKTKETSDHVWHCDVLKNKRRELDVDLAEADPEDFTPAMRQGVACAMNADPTRTFWGRM